MSRRPQLNKQDFLDSLNQPPVDHICDLISEAIYEALDGGNFSIELAKQFIIDVVKETPDSAVNKFKEMRDKEERIDMENTKICNEYKEHNPCAHGIRTSCDCCTFGYIKGIKA